MGTKVKLDLNRKSVLLLGILTALLLLGLTAHVVRSIQKVDALVRENCFDELSQTSRALADTLRDSIRTDRTILSAIAVILANEEDTGNENLCKILDAYSLDDSYLSYLELLRPDGTMLDADGTVRDVSDAFDFAADAAAGPRLSHVSHSTRNPDEKVVRSIVPVMKNGEPAYILYGVVRLSDLPGKFTTSIYDGHAYVLVVDGDTGDFLMDTWHSTLGNINELGKRTALPGYSTDEMLADVAAGVGGQIGFVSRTTGGILYLRYDPIGVNNWNLIVQVEEKYAMANGEAITAVLYRMAAVIGMALLLYVVVVSVCLLGAYRQAKKLGITDQTTGLMNRNAYDKYVQDHQNTVYPSIVCIYVDVNGLHDINNRFGHTVGDQMLCIVARALAERFATSFVYRIGGDEFIVFCPSESLEVCSEKMQDVIREVESHDYHIAYGMLRYENETGVGRIIREADEKMLANKREYYTLHDRRSR